MKKTTLLLATLLAGASLSAQEPASSYSVTVDFPYATKYVFRGLEFAQGAFQPSVKLTSGDFYAGVWMSAPADRGYELEIDYYAGYGFKLAEGWALDTGLTVYTYPGLDTSDGSDKATFEGYLGVNGTVGVITTGTYAYYDMTLEILTLQEVLGYSITLDDKTAVNLSATLGHVVPNGGGGYTYYGFGLAVPYKLSDKATVTAGVQYADHDMSGVEGSHFWGTLGFTYTF